MYESKGIFRPAEVLYCSMVFLAVIVVLANSRLRYRFLLRCRFLSSKGELALIFKLSSSLRLCISS